MSDSNGPDVLHRVLSSARIIAMALRGHACGTCPRLATGPEAARRSAGQCGLRSQPDPQAACTSLRTRAPARLGQGCQPRHAPAWQAPVPRHSRSMAGARRKVVSEMEDLSKIFQRPRADLPPPASVVLHPSAGARPTCLTVSGGQHTGPSLPQSRQKTPVCRTDHRAPHAPLVLSSTIPLAPMAPLVRCEKALHQWVTEPKVARWSRDTWP